LVLTLFLFFLTNLLFLSVVYRLRTIYRFFEILSTFIFHHMTSNTLIGCRSRIFVERNMLKYKSLSYHTFLLSQRTAQHLNRPHGTVTKILDTAPENSTQFTFRFVLPIMILPCFQANGNIMLEVSIEEQIIVQVINSVREKDSRVTGRVYIHADQSSALAV